MFKINYLRYGLVYNEIYDNLGYIRNSIRLLSEKQVSTLNELNTELQVQFLCISIGGILLHIYKVS